MQSPPTDPPAAPTGAASVSQPAGASAPRSAAATAPPAGLLFTSGVGMLIPADPPTEQPVPLVLGNISVASLDAPVAGRLFLASCGAARLRNAADVLRADTRVTSVNGPLAAAGSYGYVEAVTTATVAAAIAAQINSAWSATPGAIGLATAEWFAGEPAWWLRPVIGANHVPASAKWRENWPVLLVEELSRRGIGGAASMRLSKRGGGVWLAGSCDPLDGARGRRGAATRWGVSPRRWRCDLPLRSRARPVGAAMRGRGGGAAGDPFGRLWSSGGSSPHSTPGAVSPGVAVVRRRRLVRMAWRWGPMCSGRDADPHEPEDVRAVRRVGHRGPRDSGDRGACAGNRCGSSPTDDICGGGRRRGEATSACSGAGPCLCSAGGDRGRRSGGQSQRYDDGRAACCVAGAGARVGRGIGCGGWCFLYSERPGSRCGRRGRWRRGGGGSSGARRSSAAAGHRTGAYGVARGAGCRRRRAVGARSRSVGATGADDGVGRCSDGCRTEWRGGYRAGRRAGRDSGGGDGRRRHGGAPAGRRQPRRAPRSQDPASHSATIHAPRPAVPRFGWNVCPNGHGDGPMPAREAAVLRSRFSLTSLGRPILLRGARRSSSRLSGGMGLCSPSIGTATQLSPSARVRLKLRVSFPAFSWRWRPTAGTPSWPLTFPPTPSTHPDVPGSTWTPGRTERAGRTAGSRCWRMSQREAGQQELSGDVPRADPPPPPRFIVQSAPPRRAQAGCGPLQCACCGRVGALASGCSATWRDGSAGHLCRRVGGCVGAGAPRSPGPLASMSVGQITRAAGTLSLGGGPARLSGVPSSETFCAALWSLALARERREGWVTVGSSPLAVPAGYVALRAGSADLRLPPWEEVLAALDGIVPRDAVLMPVPRHYDGSVQEQWLQLSSGGTLPAALAALETWAAHAAAVRVAAGSPTREQSVGGDAEMRVAGRRARPPGAAARVAAELPCATGSPAGATAVRLFPRARRVGAAAGRGSGRGAAPVRGADVEASSRAAPPAADPAFGACSGTVPTGVAEIKALMAALPCNLPGHVDGWMRKQAFHLQPHPRRGTAPRDGLRDRRGAVAVRDGGPWTEDGVRAPPPGGCGGGAEVGAGPRGGAASGARRATASRRRGVARVGRRPRSSRGCARPSMRRTPSCARGLRPPPASECVTCSSAVASPQGAPRCTARCPCRRRPRRSRCARSFRGRTRAPRRPATLSRRTSGRPPRRRARIGVGDSRTSGASPQTTFSRPRGCSAPARRPARTAGAARTSAASRRCSRPRSRSCCGASFGSLSDTYDPLLACSITDATVGASRSRAAASAHRHRTVRGAVHGGARRQARAPGPPAPP